jgi:2-amino-4-hydroxy-6-hydroxymethyldihydropteridine diphosphokinase
MRVYLSLGSNLGRSVANLLAARDALAETDGVRVLLESECYETDPVGVEDQPAFVNAALEVETNLGPSELLDRIKDIEGRLGRVPTGRWGPRAIDIDIVLWGDMVMDSEPLTLPHKEFRNRAFVLMPLAEIAPEAIDPVTGSSVAELAAQTDPAGVRRLGRMSEFTCTRDESGGH